MHLMQLWMRDVVLSSFTRHEHYIKRPIFDKKQMRLLQG
jgi:hypothetical protein